MSPVLTVQSGPKNARTDPDTGVRLYTWQGVEYPSVTSVRRLAGLPHNLAVWYQNKVIDRAITDFPTLQRMIQDGSEPKAIASWLRKAPTDERDAAGDLGKKVHDAAERGLTLADVGPDVAPYLAQYKAFLADTGFASVMKERQVWNTSVGYAGTFDDVGRFRKSPDDLWLIDLKTGKGTYPEHAFQLEAYRRAEFVGEDDVIDEIATKMLHQITHQGVLHLKPEGWAFKTIPPTDRTWIAFRGLLAFARWTFANPTLDTLIGHTAEGSAQSAGV